MPIQITFIGLCRPTINGVGVWGYMIFNNDVVIHQAAAVAGTGMNAYASNLLGLREACRWLHTQNLPGDVILAGNNETVLRQVRGKWKLKVPRAKQVVPEIQHLLQGRQVSAGLLTPAQIKAVRALAKAQYRHSP